MEKIRYSKGTKVRVIHSVLNKGYDDFNNGIAPSMIDMSEYMVGNEFTVQYHDATGVKLYGSIFEWPPEIFTPVTGEVDLGELRRGDTVHFRSGGTAEVAGMRMGECSGVVHLKGYLEMTYLRNGSYYPKEVAPMDIVGVTKCQKPKPYNYMEVKVGDTFQYDNDTYDFTQVRFIGDDPRDPDGEVGLFVDVNNSCRIIAVYKDNRLGKFLGNEGE